MGMKIIAVLVGLVFLGLAAMYWLIPAGGLPAFVPGFVAGSTEIHVKHAFGMFVVAFLALAFAFILTRREAR